MATPSVEQTLEQIARQHCFFPDLQERHCGEDFREVAVWSLKAALEAAYEAGRQAKG